jgi:hypothetical protein
LAFKGGGYGFGAAYNYAKKLTFNGLKGYLATITTEEEEAVLDSISSQSGWAGAVDLKSIKAPDSDTYDGCGITVTYSPAVGADRTADTCETNKNNFKWICGPEATIDNGTMNTYSKGRWDGTELVKQPSGWGGNSAEYLLGIHFAKGWNDYPGDGSALTAGYFVEFSAYGDYGKTVTSESYSSSIDTDNWGAWSMTAANESSWSVQGKATRTSTTSPSVTDNWTPVPVLPQQPTKAQETQKIGDFWTESSFTEPTANNKGSVTFTATGSHVGETGTTISTSYTFSITKTLMKLAAVSVPTASSTETVLSNLTAKAYYKIAASDGTEVVLQPMLTKYRSF